MDNYTTCPQCWCTFEATSAARRAELESLLALEQSANARLRAEVERLRDTVAFLRACVPPTRPTDYGHEAWSAALRAEVAAERAAERGAVVAWLREHGDQRRATLADRIERGEHRREETK